ncbi:2-amino-4-hydroxy-6-hydroxymethyldihydropteridine diphosphokinase [Nisaea acidiphila]|uniref:2-amino-4-hydroxy-6-hydroxymethyldihydropteridine pyrophosphokinase n=1 Tax=Nisaea acidiphila TaxID=1862145 RepID=A0A9J7AVW6_9PROT|nr:2-amino-4-hydroxy-6-hydroxymethyldihydropteridine diphosphokinase [Nisaea acidiphila]UUX50420.1 2-amino-4-hydroxy-6-hydroxymethyldihydropteridine diphosphokinase [Nisaea acidiphila]
MIYLGVGANLPSPEFSTPRATLEAAMQELAKAGVKSVAVSRWYESAPVPISDQPWYVNAVFRVETDLSAVRLLEAMHRVEAEFGRVRAEVNAARVIDLDIVDYRGERNALDGGPLLPHPRMHERAFVLLPLRDLAPDWIHPGTGTHIDDLIAGLDPDQVIRLLKS